MDTADIIHPDPLTLEFLRWVARQPRTYVETMDAWRTGCPRFPVWENAHDAGLVRVQRPVGSGSRPAVMLTAAGRALLSLEPEGQQAAD